MNATRAVIHERRKRLRIETTRAPVAENYGMAAARHRALQTVNEGNVEDERSRRWLRSLALKRRRTRGRRLCTSSACAGYCSL